MKLLWFIPRHGDGRYLGTSYGGRPLDFGYLKLIACAVDNLGFYGALLPTGRSCEDAWVTASSLISETHRMRFLVVGGSIGFLLGLLNGLSVLADRVLDSSVQMVRNIPHLAMIPLVILWFGIEEEAKLFLITIGVFFPIYINTVHGIRSIDPRLIQMARSYVLGGSDCF